MEPLSSGSRNERKFNMKTLAIGGGVVLTVILVGVIAFQFIENRRLRNPNFHSDQLRAEAQALANRVGRLMQLPDEEVTVATVQDASRLHGQEFFRDANNGDKVLIFTEARRAVIFRESTNMIINSGPIVINSTSAGLTE